MAVEVCRMCVGVGGEHAAGCPVAHESHATCDHAYGHCTEEWDNNFRDSERKSIEEYQGFAAGEGAAPFIEHMYSVSKWYKFGFDRAQAEVA